MQYLDGVLEKAKELGLSQEDCMATITGVKLVEKGN